jgi:hypothetical protein
MSLSDKLLLCTVFTEWSCLSSTKPYEPVPCSVRHGLPLLILAIICSFGVSVILAKSWCLCIMSVPAFCLTASWLIYIDPL